MERNKRATEEPVVRTPSRLREELAGIFHLFEYLLQSKEKVMQEKNSICNW